ncbi:hypothetical protein OG21DRAFT_266301 [Imleria badia]|nr:hypothetical protein OG21DRAFT_266301 [Imleria badia]
MVMRLAFTIFRASAGGLLQASLHYSGNDHVELSQMVHRMASFNVQILSEEATLEGRTSCRFHLNIFFAHELCIKKSYHLNSSANTEIANRGTEASNSAPSCPMPVIVHVPVKRDIGDWPVSTSDGSFAFRVQSRPADLSGFKILVTSDTKMILDNRQSSCYDNKRGIKGSNREAPSRSKVCQPSTRPSPISSRCWTPVANEVHGHCSRTYLRFVGIPGVRGY